MSDLVRLSGHDHLSAAYNLPLPVFHLQLLTVLLEAFEDMSVKALHIYQKGSGQCVPLPRLYLL